MKDVKAKKVKKPESKKAYSKAVTAKLAKIKASKTHKIQSKKLIKDKEIKIFSESLMTVINEAVSLLRENMLDAKVNADNRVDLAKFILSFGLESLRINNW